MHFSFTGDLPHLISTYGYWVVGVIVGLESMGLAVPGETTLIAAAMIAGTAHTLDIPWVIAAAAGGAVIGDNIGYWLGRRFGHSLLLRYGRYIGLSEKRIRLGQYLFLRHGGKVVFFGRFVAVLRALAAVLAGTNYMPWGRFFLANAAGGILWATTYGLAAYYMGEGIQRFAKPVGFSLAAVAAIVLVVGFMFLRRHEAELERKAAQALPGPLQPVGKNGPVR